MKVKGVPRDSPTNHIHTNTPNSAPPLSVFFLLSRFPNPNPGPAADQLLFPNPNPSHSVAPPTNSSPPTPASLSPIGAPYPLLEQLRPSPDPSSTPTPTPTQTLAAAEEGGGRSPGRSDGARLLSTSFSPPLRRGRPSRPRSDQGAFDLLQCTPKRPRLHPPLPRHTADGRCTAATAMDAAAHPSCFRSPRFPPRLSYPVDDASAALHDLTPRLLCTWCSHPCPPAQTSSPTTIPSSPSLWKKPSSLDLTSPLPPMRGSLSSAIPKSVRREPQGCLHFAFYVEGIDSIGFRGSIPSFVEPSRVMD